MNLHETLQQALPIYDVVPLTQDNFADFCEVFDTNRDFLVKNYGKLVDEKGLLGAVAQLVDGFDPGDKYLAAICQGGRAIAVVDLLANLTAKNELFISVLMVRSDLQGKGFGATFAKGIITAARRAGFSRVTLGTDDSAAKFWEKMGFVQERESGGYKYYAIAF